MPKTSANSSVLAKPPSKIDRLPDNILTDIFVTSVTGFPNILDSPLPRGFLRVCKRWKKLALNTARLWNACYLPLFDERHYFLDEILGRWIKRSNPLPFSIWAAKNQDVEDESEEYYPCSRHLEKVICGAASRWGDIDVEMPLEGARHVVLTALESKPSSLTSLVVSSTSEEDEDPEGLDIPSMLLPTLPNIPHVEITGFLVVLEKKVDLGAMQVLNLGSFVEGDSFIQLIQSAPNLEKLRVRFKGREIQYNGKPVTAAKLSSLNVQFDVRVDDQDGDRYIIWDLSSEGGTADFSKNPPGIYMGEDSEDDESGDEDGDEDGYDFSVHIFQKITAPSLTTFCLTETQNWGTTQLPSVSDFFKRSGCPLKRFYYCNEYSSPEMHPTIRSICKKTPTIEELEIRTSARWDEFAPLLSDLADPKIMPVLTKFTYVIRDLTLNSRNKEFRKFIECRSPRRGGALQRVALLKGSHSYQASPIRGKKERSVVTGCEDLGVNISLDRCKRQDSCPFDW